MKVPSTTLFRFDDFIHEPEEMRLRFGDQNVHLTPKAIEVLTFLVKNPYRLIRKEELMGAVWGDSFVEESNLNVTISMIRRSLAKFSDKQYIETISKVGFRFNADVISESAKENEFNDQAAELDVPPTVAELTSFHRSDVDQATLIEAVGGPYQPTNYDAPHDAQKFVERRKQEVITPQFTDSQVRRALLPSRLSIYVGLGLFATAAILIAARLMNISSPEPQKSVTLSSLTSSGNVAEMAVSPDGKFLAYARIEKNKQSLWLKNIRTPGSEILLVAPTLDEFRGVRFTPDGAKIYYNLKPKNDSITDLYATAVLGGSPRLIARDVDSPVAISPDGKSLAFMRRNVKSGVTALFIASADGTDIREIASRTSPQSFMLKPLDWSPDGKKLLCVGTDQTFERKRRLIEIQVVDGRTTLIGDQVWDTFDSVAWASDGSGIYFSASDIETPLRTQLWYKPYPDGNAKQISTDLYDYSTISVAKETGDIAALHSIEESSVWIWTPDNKKDPKRVNVNPTVGQHGIAITKNDRLVFTDGLNGINSLHISDFDSSNNAEVTEPSKSTYRFPRVTTDGETIVYVSAQTGIKNIWRVKADGGEAVRLTRGTNDEEFPTLSPDDKWVYYNTVSNGQTSIWKVAMDGGEAIQVTNVISVRPQISPDGSKIACYYREAPKAPWQLGIISANEGEVEKTVTLPVSVRLNSPFQWAKDGKALIVVDKSSGVENLSRLEIASGELTPITSFTDELLPIIYSFDLRRDKELYVITRGREARNVVSLSAN